MNWVNYVHLHRRSQINNTRISCEPFITEELGWRETLRLHRFLVRLRSEHGKWTFYNLKYFFKTTFVVLQVALCHRFNPEPRFLSVLSCSPRAIVGFLVFFQTRAGRRLLSNCPRVCECVYTVFCDVLVSHSFTVTLTCIDWRYAC